MEKGRSPQSSTQVQPSPGGSKELLTDKYTTCREDIAELAITDIQPCPIIPDYQTPTLSSLPIFVRTPEACFCIDGFHYIEQATAEGRSTVRCHVYHIAEHSIIELAIRKAAIRVMPQGGKCSYAELVRNAHRLYQVLMNTSDDLVLFTHGGARRGSDFTDSRDSNIRAVLANRLGKSQTTINKYLQHGDGLNDAAMEALVNSGVTKSFFEAFQARKPTIVADQQSEQKDPVAITEAVSNEVMQWLAEPQEPEAPPAKEQEGEPPPPQTERSRPVERPASSGSRGPVPTPRSPQDGSDNNQNPPASDPTPTGEDGMAAGGPTPTEETVPAAELKRIGEALIEIADGQESPTPQQIESIRTLIVELSTLLSRLDHPSEPEGSGNGGED
jgi:hypothetical protein